MQRESNQKFAEIEPKEIRDCSTIFCSQRIGKERENFKQISHFLQKYVVTITTFIVNRNLIV